MFYQSGKTESMFIHNWNTDKSFNPC